MKFAILASILALSSSAYAGLEDAKFSVRPFFLSTFECRR
jgi:hypothetical protein